MKDFQGLELAIGDEVAFNPPYYKGLKRGKVIGFTPQMVKLDYPDNNLRNTRAQTRTEPWNVVKIQSKTV